MFERDPDPDFNRRDPANDEQRPMPMPDIGDWIRESEPGKRLRYQLREECSSYASPSDFDRMKAHIEALESVRPPTSLYEIVLNYFDRESDRQQSAQISLEKARTEMETATLENVEIIGRISPLVDRFVEEEFAYSPNLKSLLEQINVHLSLDDQRKEYWDKVDQETTRLAGSGYAIALPALFKKLPEHTQWQINEAFKEAHVQDRRMHMEQLRMINEWDPLPAKFTDMYVSAKEGALKIPITLECKDIVVACRSAIKVGDCFLNGWKYPSSEDTQMEEELKYDRVIDTLIMLKEALETAKKEVAGQVAALGKDILSCLLRK